MDAPVTPAAGLPSLALTKRSSATVAAASATAAAAVEAVAAAAAGSAAQASLYDLPDELLLDMFAKMSCKDVCSLTKTCRRFRDLCLSAFVQNRIHFGGNWPNSVTAHLYERASNCDNLEAALKLGVASLYGEGVDACAPVAAAHLDTAEIHAQGTKPFTWLLVRPPWSSDSCSKASIFQNLLERASEEIAGPDDSALEQYLDRRRRARLLFCGAKIHALRDPPLIDQARDWFAQSLELGCGDAAIELIALADRYACENIPDAMTLLQQSANSGSLDVELRLCLEYCRGISPMLHKASQQKQYIRQFVQRGCKPLLRRVMPQSQLDNAGKMRHILTDWLVEVADLKSFKRETLYAGVTLVDRFLGQCSITRKTLQLIGITCMVVASRFLEEEVITIREAAWLTDNTYVYEQVVRTVGQCLFTARGEVRCPTTLDYITLYLALAKAQPQLDEFAHFISETSLLHFPTTQYPPAIMAAAAFYLASFLGGYRDCWPAHLETLTGLTLKDFAEPLESLYLRSFCSEPVRDHRGVALSSVYDRYVKRTQENMIPNLFPAAPPSLSALQEAISSKLQEDFTMELAGRERLKFDCTPTFDEHSSSSFRPLRTLTNVASAAEQPLEPKRSRRSSASAADDWL